MQDENLPGRVPPHNLEAERALLGALLIEPGRVADAREVVQPQDCFSQRHAAIYAALLALDDRSQPIDFVSVGEALAQSGQFQQVGGRAYLAELTTLVTSGAHSKHHARIVAETALLRRLIQASSEIIDQAYDTRADGESVRQLVDASETRIFEVARQTTRSEAVPIGTAVAEAFKRIDSTTHRRGLTGLPSGYYDLDELLCGFNQGELIVVAARPSMGKTALVLNCIDWAADPDHAPDWIDHQPTVLFFSLEMGQQSIVRRMLCSRARVDAHNLRTGRIPNEDYAELSRAAGELQRMSIFIDDTPGISASALRSRIKRFARSQKLDMVVVDYLQLMSGSRSENRQQEISQISRSLKELAREFELPVIALSQLTRQVELREDKRPQLSDLRESGSIEQDADVVLLLFREDYYKRDDPEVKGQAELICAKQRNGPTGTVKLMFNSAIMRFENRAPSSAETFQG